MNLSKWLKRIFSAQSMTVVLAIVSINIAYFAYRDNKTGDISIAWSEKINFEGEVTEKVEVICFYSNENYNDLYVDFLIPEIINNTSRQVKGLKISYTIQFYKCLADVNPLYYTVDRYSGQTVDYIYSNSILAAKSKAETPLSNLKCSSFDNCFRIKANISYDGVSKPLTYDYLLLNHIVSPKENAEQWECYCIYEAKDLIMNGYSTYLYLNGKEASDDSIVVLGPFTKENFEEEVREYGYEWRY